MIAIPHREFGVASDCGRRREAAGSERTVRHRYATRRDLRAQQRAVFVDIGAQELRCIESSGVKSTRCEPGNRSRQPF